MNQVDCLGHDFEDILRRARLAIREANDPPRLFCYKGKPATVDHALWEDQEEYRAILSSLCRWKAKTKRGRAPWGVCHVTWGEAAELFPPLPM